MPIHPPDALEKHLPPTRHIGLLSEASISALNLKEKTKDDLRVEQARKQMPPLYKILSLDDMEVRFCVSSEHHVGLERT